MHYSLYSPEKSSEYDVIVVGTGFIGLTLVSLLAPLGLRIAVVSSSLSDVQKDLYNPKPEALDGRMIALTPSVQQQLELMGIWQKLPLETVGVCRKMRVWDANHTEVTLENSSLLKTPLAYIVTPSLMQQLLWNHVSQIQTVTWINSASIKDIEHRSEKVYVYLEQGACLQGALIIGADGAKSQVRSLSGISCVSKSYEQTALVTMIHHTLHHQATAFQVFLKSGPLAFLPTANPHYSAVIWSTTPEQAHDLHTLSEARFCQQVSQAAIGYMEGVQAAGARYITPLYSHHADCYVKPRIALVGDAAHRPHPLAGQGANLGVADVVCLAQVIGEAWQAKQDIGSYRYLRKYERKQRVLNSMMLNSIDFIRNVFAQQRMQTLRRLGLRGIQSCAGLKRAMIRYASGKRSDIILHH